MYFFGWDNVSTVFSNDCIPVCQKVVPRHPFAHAWDTAGPLTPACSPSHHNERLRSISVNSKYATFSDACVLLSTKMFPWTISVYTGSDTLSCIFPPITESSICLMNVTIDLQLVQQRGGEGMGVLSGDVAQWWKHYYFMVTNYWFIRLNLTRHPAPCWSGRWCRSIYN